MKLFKLFSGNTSKANKIKRLTKKHRKLMEAAFELSKVNRKESDAKHAEAELVMKEILNLEKKD